MTTVFISGSMEIKNLDKKIVQKIDSIIERNHKVIVGDASGVDSSIQKLLKQKEYKNVTVFCSGNTVRKEWLLKIRHQMQDYSIQLKISRWLKCVMSVLWFGIQRVLEH